MKGLPWTYDLRIMIIVKGFVCYEFLSLDYVGQSVQINSVVLNFVKWILFN